MRYHFAAPGVAAWTVTVTTARRASSARQHGIDCYLRALDSTSPLEAVAVLSTDSDTIVPSDWISIHIGLLESGFDAVAGIVELDAGVDEGDLDHGDLDHAEWFDEYTAHFRPDGHHPHVHCANLSVRLDTLRRAGGFGHAHRAEDIDLWRRLARVPGASLSANTSSVVRTSHRRDGRVVGGFATALNSSGRTPASNLIPTRWDACKFRPDVTTRRGATTRLEARPAAGVGRWQTRAIRPGRR